jgi:cathepsin D
VVSTPPPNNGTITEFPHQGLVGFGGTAADQTQLGGTPFFQNLCDQKVVDQCRYGLAFGTNGTGVQVLGGVDEHLVSGSFVYSDVSSNLLGSVVADGKTILTDQIIILDSGTANVSSTFLRSTTR